MPSTPRKSSPTGVGGHTARNETGRPMFEGSFPSEFRTSNVSFAQTMGQTMSMTFGRSPLSDTAAAGAKEINPTTKHFTGRLTTGAACGNVDVVRKLLAESPDLIDEPDLDRCTALMAAADAGQLEVVKLLLNAGAATSGRDGSKETALYKAARQGHAEIARLLIEHPDTDLNASTTIKATALHEAAARGREEIVHLLLGRHAEVDPKDGTGVTPLQVACAENHKGIAAALIAAGADPCSKDRDGLTPLMVAAFEGHADVVSLLLARGVEVDAINKNGHTALHMAYGNCKPACAQALLAAGANANLADPSGIRPADILKARETQGFWTVAVQQERASKTGGGTSSPKSGARGAA